MGDDAPAFNIRLGTAILGATALVGLAVVAITRGPLPGPCTAAEQRVLAVISAGMLDARRQGEQASRRLREAASQLEGARELCAQGAHDTGRVMMLGIVDFLQPMQQPIAAARD